MKKYHLLEIRICPHLVTAIIVIRRGDGGVERAAVMSVLSKYLPVRH